MGKMKKLWMPMENPTKIKQIKSPNCIVEFQQSKPLSLKILSQFLQRICIFSQVAAAGSIL